MTCNVQYKASDQMGGGGGGGDERQVILSKIPKIGVLRKSQ